ncbi:hypothetical protein L9F63_023781, partial [Diploptera punctata]
THAVNSILLQQLQKIKHALKGLENSDRNALPLTYQHTLHIFSKWYSTIPIQQKYDYLVYVNTDLKSLQSTIKNHIKTQMAPLYQLKE